jgi:hypothetical protein
MQPFGASGWMLPSKKPHGEYEIVNKYGYTLIFPRGLPVAVNKMDAEPSL